MVGAILPLIDKRIVQFRWDSRVGPVLIIDLGKRKVGFAFCHRRPERSFTIRGHILPICSRCTGLVMGIFGSIGLVLFQLHIPPTAQITLMLPLLIDGFTQFFGLRESKNVVRLIAGFLFMFGFISLLVK